jgi:hypothetical protein
MYGYGVCHYPHISPVGAPPHIAPIRCCRPIAPIRCCPPIAPVSCHPPIAPVGTCGGVGIIAIAILILVALGVIF